ncbi:hypothetical protein C8Q76DRAFT_750548, partial [Earliella scabrosa]
MYVCTLNRVWCLLCCALQGSPNEAATHLDRHGSRKGSRSTCRSMVSTTLQVLGEAKLGEFRQSGRICQSRPPEG